MKTKTIGKMLLVLIISVFSCYGLRAQTAATYSFSSIASTYTYLSGGTALNIIEDDEEVSGAIPIGFTFNYCGTNYTQVLAGSNGWVSFNTSLTSSYYSNSLGNLGSIKPALFPLWDDLSGDGTGIAAYKTTGTAPSREFILEYRSWLWNYGAGSAVISFQVKLFEGTNVIQFRYQQEGGAVNSGSASIGIGDNGATPTYLSLNNTTASPAASSTTFTTGISSKPSNGRVYQFTPPPPTCGVPAPGATTASPSVLSCLGDSTTLSITTAPSGTGNSYQWQSSPDNVSYTNIAGALSSSCKVAPVSATWYRCQVTCANGPVSVASTPRQISFSSSGPSVTNGTRCGTGTVDLAASAASGSLKWYTAASGGAAAGSGSSFTTPAISSTTTYYVGAEGTSSGTVAIGAGALTTTSTSSGADETSPFDHYYGGFKAQYLFRASELSAMGLEAGNITAIGFDVVSGGILYKGFNMSIKATAATTLGGTAESGLTNVFSTTSPAGLTTPASGMLTLSFSSPFYWDGTSNIVIETCWSNNNTGGTGTTVKYDATSFVSHNYYQSDSKTPAVICGGTSMSTLSRRPKVVFSGNRLCSSPRTPVTATVNTAPAFSLSGTQTVCNNSAAQLEVSSPAINYTEYTWSPVSNLFTDPACTIPYLSGASAVTVYAKTATAGSVTYTCNAYNSSSYCAATGNITIITLPAAVTATASPSFRCMSGTVSLSLSPSPSGFGAASYQWAESDDNAGFTDIAPATGSSYTTPALTVTKYYRVTIRNSAGGVCLNSVSDTALVYKPGLASSMGASRCGPGPVTLSATATDGTVNCTVTNGNPQRIISPIQI